MEKIGVAAMVESKLGPYPEITIGGQLVKIVSWHMCGNIEENAMLTITLPASQLYWKQG